jgi:trypsin
LSAAHCLDFDTPANQINLWGGSTSRLSGGHVFFVDRYLNHPQYNSISWDFDISILFVDQNTLLSGFPHVSPVELTPVCNSQCCSVCVQGNDVRELIEESLATHNN